MSDTKVLVFHKTNGFRHTDAINKGIILIQKLGDTLGWQTDNSMDASVFTEANLANYDLVIWHNTSGDNLLTVAQQEAFENYMYKGGAYMGIHAATDTYRNKSWPFYNELVGAIVQTSPNHTSNSFNGTMDVVNQIHPAVSHLSSTWNKIEEYYYWQLNGGQLSNDNSNLLVVRATGTQSFGGPRPIAWYKTSILVNGVRKSVRSFYTALGHHGANYETDENFKSHIKGAITWSMCLGNKKTWNGKSWSPAGAPMENDKVILTGNYNTSIHGALNVCSIFVQSGATLTASGANKVMTGKRIFVDGNLELENNGEVIASKDPPF